MPPRAWVYFKIAMGQELLCAFHFSTFENGSLYCSSPVVAPYSMCGVGGLENLSLMFTLLQLRAAAPKTSRLHLDLIWMMRFYT